MVEREDCSHNATFLMVNKKLSRMFSRVYMLQLLKTRGPLLPLALKKTVQSSILKMVVEWVFVTEVCWMYWGSRECHIPTEVCIILVTITKWRCKHNQLSVIVQQILHQERSFFFTDCDIIEHQHIAGVESPAVRFIDTEKRLTNVNIQITSATKHKLLLEVQFTELVFDTIKEIFIELVAVSGDYLPFVGNSRVGITLKFGKLWQCCRTFPGKL